LGNELDRSSSDERHLDWMASEEKNEAAPATKGGFDEIDIRQPANTNDKPPKSRSKLLTVCPYILGNLSSKISSTYIQE
jgi:hypothetical protein